MLCLWDRWQEFRHQNKYFFLGQLDEFKQKRNLSGDGIYSKSFNYWSDVENNCRLSTLPRSHSQPKILIARLKPK